MRLSRLQSPGARLYGGLVGRDECGGGEGVCERHVLPSAHLLNVKVPEYHATCVNAGVTLLVGKQDVCVHVYLYSVCV